MQDSRPGTVLHRSWSQPTAVAGALLVSTFCWGRPVAAHDLKLDRMSLWPDLEHARLRGQVTFDPELTRELDLPPKPAEAGKRVRRFLRENLTIAIDQKPCRPKFEVRELYSESGAVPGDVVMLTCPLSTKAQQLSVTLGAAFPSLVVTVAEAGGGSTGDAEHSVLVRAGETSPAYHLTQAEANTWRTGNAESFVVESSAVAAPSRLAQAAPAAASGQSIGPEPVAVGSRVAGATPNPTAPQKTGFEGASPWSATWRFLQLGVTHIVPKGLDHVLFVASVALGVGQRFRRLALELSVFTLAHTLTLALGALHWLVVPGRIVEPLIALSIAYVAAQNLLGKVRQRQRLLVVFFFGLVHGLGFAGALAEQALPRHEFLWALLGFNLGVEAGQLMVAACVILLLQLTPLAFHRRVVITPVSLLTLALSSYWMLERSIG